MAEMKPKAPVGVFGSLVVRTSPGTPNKQWVQVFQRIQAERRSYKLCDDDPTSCHPNLAAWRNAISSMRKLSGDALLEAVNSNVNRLVRYSSDKRAFGRRDHWATPVEVLAGFGDCEDYAILKYVTLRELGVEDNGMRIVVVKDEMRNVGHAVLAVHRADGIKILDNRSKILVEHTDVSNYKPLYSVNRNGRWLNLAVRQREVRYAGKPKSAKSKTIFREPARKLEKSTMTLDLLQGTGSRSTRQARAAAAAEKLGLLMQSKGWCRGKAAACTF
ncbi:MAG: transglutaminase-like cysteine peptidase [Hyphomicrobiales bacterium]